MNKYLEILKECEMFDKIEDNDILKILSCFDVQIHSYSRNQNIINEGDKASCIGIMLSGTAQIVRVDFYGNRSIIASVLPSQLFGEAFVCSEAERIPVNVIAEEDCEVMMIDSGKIMRPCCKSCEFHNQIIFNLLKLTAKKNLLLNQKIEIISKRTTREKLITYLNIQAKKYGSSFTIPYDRQELADFLEVERSGLSAEISKLRSEKIIECKRSFFRLL